MQGLPEVLEKRRCQQKPEKCAAMAMGEEKETKGGNTCQVLGRWNNQETNRAIGRLLLKTKKGEEKLFSSKTA